jgi:GTP-binding protein
VQVLPASARNSLAFVTAHYFSHVRTSLAFAVHRSSIAKTMQTHPVSSRKREVRVDEHRKREPNPEMHYTTQFLLSAVDASHFPAATVPEIAFLGRSNVGKSSLLNALVGEKAAKVSQTPGRTRAINFFALLDQKQQPRLAFADLPGYGYAKISKSISAGWPAFIEPYLAIRETLKLCVCLVDSNIPPQPSDAKLFDWLRHVGRDFLVVATKTDRLSGNERTRNLLAIRKEFGLPDVLAVSAKTGTGVKELWNRIEAAGSIF